MRKGVSPVVAIILLILVAVAAAIVLYAWVSSLAASAKSSGTSKTSVAFDIEEASLKVKANYTNTAAGIVNTTLVNATVFVRNIGSVPIENGTWTIYIIDPNTNTIIPDNTSSYLFTFNKTIGVAEIVNTSVIFMNSTLYSNLKPGYYYIIELHSPQGAVDKIRVKCVSD